MSSLIDALRDLQVAALCLVSSSMASLLVEVSNLAPFAYCSCLLTRGCVAHDSGHRKRSSLPADGLCLSSMH